MNDLPTQPPEKKDDENNPFWSRFRRGYTVDELIELRRSRVRRWISYSAMGFLFIGGAVFIGYLTVTNGDTKAGTQLGMAHDLFMTIIPIASGIIGYWFAEQRKNGNGGNKGE